MKILLIISTILILILGCGKKGDLYLPEKTHQSKKIYRKWIILTIKKTIYMLKTYL